MKQYLLQSLWKDAEVQKQACKQSYPYFLAYSMQRQELTLGYLKKQGIASGRQTLLLQACAAGNVFGRVNHEWPRDKVETSSHPGPYHFREVKLGTSDLHDVSIPSLETPTAAPIRRYSRVLQCKALPASVP